MAESLDARAKRVFEQAIEQHGPARAAELDRACCGAAELRARVEVLLAAAEKQDAFLSAPAVTDFHSLDSVSSRQRPGERVGPYLLRELIGEGGFGSVFLAEQTAPLRRTVALKIIKAGMDTRQVLARFEAERQALALMDHPNIARVLEAGATEQGGPYFVMELVRGPHVTRYCDEQRLSLAQRLELFRDICAAVQHAHQKGIIHRDLKPSNILVTNGDGRPLVKVIDFGIAKAAAGQLGDATLTQQFQFLGTPAYMSPEQARQCGADVDTRSDIYSLGVLLYELLTGATPFDRRRLGSASLAEVHRIIREQEPPRPSARIALGSGGYEREGSPDSSANHGISAAEPLAASASPDEIASRRRAEPAQLRRALRGDLDWIVLKCLEKQPARRYETASALNDDIGRYLRHEPVQAGPPSAAYRLRKFVQRNRGGVFGVVLVAASLLAAAGVALAFAVSESRQRALAEAALVRARQAEDLAQTRAGELEAVARFQEQQLSRIDAAQMGARLRADLLENARAALERGGDSADDTAAGLRQLEERLAGADFTGMALESLQDNFFQPALAAIAAEFADQPLVKAQLLQSSADTLRQLGLLDAADAPQAEALAIRRRELGAEHLDTLISLTNLGQLLWAQGKLPQAEQCARDALEQCRRSLGNEHPQTLLALNNFAAILSARGHSSEAEAQHRQALETRRRVLGEDHPDTLLSLSNLGAVLQAQGKLAEAAECLRDALERRRRVLGDEHPDTLLSINNMGALLNAQGKRNEAEAYYREAFEKHRRVLGSEHPYTLASINNLGLVLRAQGRLAEAEPLLREALAGYRRVLGDAHPSTINSIQALGLLLQTQGKLSQAEACFREALALRLRTQGPEDVETLNVMNSLGMLLKSAGRPAEAEPLCRESLAIRRRVQGAEHRDTLAAMNNMATVLLAQRKLPEAERLYREVLEKCRGVFGAEHANTATSLVNEGLVLHELGRFADAEPYCREALQMRRRLNGDQHVGTLKALELLGSVLRSLGENEQAIALLTQAEPAARRELVGNHALVLGRFLTALGRARTATGEFAAAEIDLREAHLIVDAAAEATSRDREETLTALLDLYEAWHAALPDAGHDRQAAEWRQALEEWQATTRPADEE